MTEPKGVGNTGFITDVDVRTWLRDLDPEMNLLIKDLEFKPEEIRAAQTLTVDFWNEEPPSISIVYYDLYQFPYRRQLLMGTVAQLLFIAANRFRRNDLTYQIGGGAINDQAKATPYEAAAEKLWKDYIDWVRRKKREINQSIGWSMI